MNLHRLSVRLSVHNCIPLIISRTTSPFITIFAGDVGLMNLHIPIDFGPRPISNMAATAAILKSHSGHYLKNNFTVHHHFCWGCEAYKPTHPYCFWSPPSSIRVLLNISRRIYRIRYITSKMRTHGDEQEVKLIHYNCRHNILK